MKKRISTFQQYFLRYAAFFALLALLAYLTRRQWAEFRNVRNVELASLLWLSAYFVTSQLLAGLALRYFTAAFDVRLSFKEWFGLVCVRSLGHYLPLSTEVTNAAYLKMRDVPRTKFASLTAGNLILTTLVAGCIGVVILVLRRPVVDSIHPPLLAFFSVVAAGSLAIIVSPLPEIRTENRLLSLFCSMHEGWRLISSRRRLFVVVVVLQTTIVALLALQYQVVLEDLGYPLDFASVLLLAVSTSTIRCASLLPANMGVRETIAGALVHAFGFPFSVGLLAALVGRLVSMIWVFALGAAFGYVILRADSVKRRSPAAAEN